MAQKKRLIELLERKQVYGIDQEQPRRNELRLIDNDEIADHLLENGAIVPPCKACKVGDMVYAFCEDFGVVLPYFVENLNIGFMDKNRDYWTYEANCHAEETDELLDEIDFDLEDIGKTVFFTQEEAEKALAERNKE